MTDELTVPPHIASLGPDGCGSSRLLCCCGIHFNTHPAKPAASKAWITKHTKCVQKLSATERKVILKAHLDKQLAQIRHHTEVSKAAGIHNPHNLRMSTEGKCWGI